MFDYEQEEWVIVTKESANKLRVLATLFGISTRSANTLALNLLEGLYHHDEDRRKEDRPHNDPVQAGVTDTLKATSTEA